MRSSEIWARIDTNIRIRYESNNPGADAAQCTSGNSPLRSQDARVAFNVGHNQDSATKDTGTYVAMMLSVTVEIEMVDDGADTGLGCCDAMLEELGYGASHDTANTDWDGPTYYDARTTIITTHPWA